MTNLKDLTDEDLEAELQARREGRRKIEFERRKRVYKFVAENEAEFLNFFEVGGCSRPEEAVWELVRLNREWLQIEEADKVPVAYVRRGEE